jgi:hypothetical protein
VKRNSASNDTDSFAVAMAMNLLLLILEESIQKLDFLRVVPFLINKNSLRAKQRLQDKFKLKGKAVLVCM